MRVAALYDIHGNLPALEAVLRDLRVCGVDAVVIGGDVVPGPMPAESIEAVYALDVPTFFVRGNGERDVLALRDGREPGSVPEGVRESMRWVARQISMEAAERLASWPATASLDIDGLGETPFCHATPRSDTELFTAITPESWLRDLFSAPGLDTVVCGHTHMQFQRTIGPTRVVNAGSVGMPFQDVGAYWVLLGPDIELRHTSYDLAEAAERIRRTSYPMAEAFAASNVLTTPSRDAMLDVFERAAAAGR